METLPTELVDTIVSWLDLRDVCALRLTGQAALEQLVRFTQPGQVGLWLQRLTLYDCIERTEQSDSDFDATELLAQAFANIRDRPASHRGNQLSLSISLEVDNFSTWDRDVTARVFHATISAIARTEIPIQELDIFGDAYLHDHHFKNGQCSLAFSDIALALSRHRTPLATSLRNCTKFCLSLGHSTRGFNFECSVRDLRLPLTANEARQNIQSLCDLLTMCPFLEELHLVWEDDDFEETDACREEREFFNQIGISCAFADLKRYELQDLDASENPIMTFFRRSPRLLELTLDGLIAHYWENPSLLRRATFQRRVLNFISGDEPRDGVGPALDPTIFNGAEDDTRIYIMHPRRELSPKNPFLANYDGKFAELRDLPNVRLLPGAPTAARM
ncbi:hypothetical protein ASPACDRAFT_45790 [Aspergillus aculeatus ATCC 16872]|uniref:F-box domain-containing protein n=1 Tax=Aspergillus aculeatus (strain ATCC 16872 / CBS 172.66 / WB 5094) TaxID=690307 RepID=A0A1L9WNF7_ASPA1|nr:uncharacterized protein ASPACDRAFT_45790 [Aspergillus aculeatus ATCC 16872]OJJ97693.1 hypothetical protein ASPACDRAFT_45790 [Aspergillus aculeatus ATCC 16872]